MTSALRFGDYILLGRTHQNPRVDSYLAHSLTDQNTSEFYLLSRLRGSARKSLPECAEAFLAAGHYLQQLTISSLCPISEVGENEGQIFWARPYINGRPLPQICKKLAHLHLNLSENILAYIGYELCKSLPGVLPAAPELPSGGSVLLGCYAPHIVIGYDGRIINTDMGLAYWLAAQPQSSVTENNWRLAYRAPEEISSGSVSATSVVYSLGVLLYEAASGRRIFGKSTASDLENKISQGVYQPLIECRPDLSAEFCNKINSLLSITPSARPDSNELADFFFTRFEGGKDALIQLLQSEFKEEQQTDAEKFSALAQKVSASNNSAHNVIRKPTLSNLGEELSLSGQIDFDEPESFDEDNVPTKETAAAEDYNATIISSANSLGLDSDDQFGTTLPAAQPVNVPFVPPVANPIMPSPTMVGQTGGQMGAYSGNPYSDSYNLLPPQQSGFTQAPVGVPQMAAVSNGMGIAGIVMIVVSSILAVTMFVLALLYSQGKAPGLQKIGLPELDNSSIEKPLQQMPDSGIVPAN